MKNWIIKKLGLKGSWSWAKKQMMKGKIVRCKHWDGALKLKIDSPKNSLLLSNFTRNQKPLPKQRLWETSNWHISYEEFTDWQVFQWDSLSKQQTKS